MTTKLLPARHAAHRPADDVDDVDDVGAGRPNPPTPPDDRRRLERIWRSPADQPRWARPALLGLLALTAVLYLWDLSASGYANSFYAAAVQAGTKSWKAFFFGSLDAGNSITVDKPPASLWVMELSGRIFGFNSWSLLAPQALEGVAAVGLLYSTVRRVASSTAGLAAGAALALTPAAVLMFRFDNPDALLVLCLVTGAYAVTRALADGRTRWLVLAGSVIGLAFLTKMLQGFLVLPAFALTYLLAGPVPLRRRIGQVLAGAAGRGGGGRLVGADRHAVAGLRPALRRRLDQRLDPGTGLRVQRPGPDLRGQRQRRRRGGRRQRFQLRRGHRLVPAVQQRDG